MTESKSSMHLVKDYIINNRKRTDGFRKREVSPYLDMATAGFKVRRASRICV